MGLFAALFKKFLDLLERLFDSLTETIDNGLQKTWIKKGVFGFAVMMGYLAIVQVASLPPYGGSGRGLKPSFTNKCNTIKIIKISLKG